MKEYILSLCFALVVGVTVNMLVPSKKYQGIMKILCGIFLISAVISPLGNFFETGVFSINTNSFFTDDEFEFRIDESKEKFFDYLTGEDEEKIAKELFDCDITMRKEGNKIYVSGVDKNKRDYISSLAKEGMEIVFED